MAESSYVEHKSSLPFSKTVDRLIETIEEVGMNIFAKIDHAAGAIEVGMQLPPTVVLIYGHARGGTPVMQAAPETALDLPLRVLVREVKWRRHRDRVSSGTGDAGGSPHPHRAGGSAGQGPAIARHRRTVRSEVARERQVERRSERKVIVNQSLIPTREPM